MKKKKKEFFQITKPLIALMLFWLTMNSSLDLIIANQQSKLIRTQGKITDIYQIVLTRHNANIKEIVEYQTEMSRLYYDVAYVCVNTQLKCNILKDNIERNSFEQRSTDE